MLKVGQDQPGFTSLADPRPCRSRKVYRDHLSPSLLIPSSNHHHSQTHCNRTTTTMKFSSILPSLAIALASFAGHVSAANKAFAGSNLYYAAGLSASEQTTLFEGLKTAGVKVLRVWLDGQSTSQKVGTGPQLTIRFSHAHVFAAGDAHRSLLGP